MDQMNKNGTPIYFILLMVKFVESLTKLNTLL